jgi:hypothetical protein
MTSKPRITRSQAVEQALAEVDGPIAVDELCERVLAIFPSTAKKPLATMRTFLRQEQKGRTLVFLDNKTVLPLPVAMRGVRFRIPISRSAAKRGALVISPAFDHYSRTGIQPEAFQLLDFRGRPIPVRVITVREQISTPFGKRMTERTAFDLGDWFRRRKVKRGDSILVTVEDWSAGRFRLDHERSRDSRKGEIQQRDQELADVFFDMLESASREQLYPFRAVPTAHARLSEPGGYPGNHWATVLYHDPRLTYDGFAIRYGERRSTLDDMFDPAEPQQGPTISAAQGREVYRFKAALWHRSGMWRTLEIQGKQTLGEEHDSSDHLGGFWKRVRRGKSKRFREVDLGDVNPLGEGSASDTQIGGLGLAPGHELKYVFDFGDWIQHRLTLEEIVEPEADAEYPRVTGQNQPRYRKCVTCKAEGRATRATWMCIECSNNEQREVLVCEDCLVRDHEDHYADEILY